MINIGYNLSIEDINEYKKFKETSAYGSYINSIINSPIFKVIMKEHIDNIDIDNDLNYLKSKEIIPSSVNSKVLNNIFKSAVSNMVSNITADAIVLKELEEVKLSELIDDINKESNISYLLGKADKKYYVEAEKKFLNNEIKEDSLAYRGLINYKKLNNITEIKNEEEVIPIKTKPLVNIQPKKQSMPTIDLNSNDIRL